MNKLETRYNCRHANTGFVCEDCVEKLISTYEENLRESIQKLPSYEAFKGKGQPSPLIRKADVLALIK